MALMGGYITLCGFFVDENGEIADPDGVALTIYNPGRTIFETHGTDELTKTAPGSYKFMFDIPVTDASEEYGYEFTGDLNGHAMTCRGAFTATWR